MIIVGPFQQNYSILREIGLGHEFICAALLWIDHKNNVAADRKRGDLVNKVKGNSLIKPLSEYSKVRSSSQHGFLAQSQREAGNP